MVVDVEQVGKAMNSDWSEEVPYKHPIAVWRSAEEAWDYETRSIIIKYARPIFSTCLRSHHYIRLILGYVTYNRNIVSCLHRTFSLAGPGTCGSS